MTDTLEQRSASPFVLPVGFHFGVATAGFQVEGGYNGPGEPRNNWYDWEHSGRVERSGIALDFWNRYEEQLDLAVQAGCNAFRLSVEWARCEPSEGVLNAAALERYAAILEGCHRRGLEPLVTLHHFTHPAWLGADFWLHQDAPERFAKWVRVVVEWLGDRCRNWVTINEPNNVAIQSYLTGSFPPGWRGAARSAARAMDHLLAAHVLAYAEVHDQQPDTRVSLNNYSFSIYQLDRVLLDVLLARKHRVPRCEVRDWLVERRHQYNAGLGRRTRIDRLFGLLTRILDVERLMPRTLAAVYSSPYEYTLDVSQIDYYDPVVCHHIRLPGHRTAGGRNWLPVRMLWDDPPNPEGLVEYCKVNRESGMEIWVVENGMCNRLKDGRSHDRQDGWDRVSYLRASLASVVRAVESGLPVTAYYHWTLADNYEWGSYEPRFGLYGVDRTSGVRWSRVDSMGQDAAGAYRSIVEGLRVGDRSVVG